MDWYQRCRYCGTFVTSVGGIRPHEEQCGEGGANDFIKSSGARDEVEGEERKPVGFPQVRVKLTRLRPDEIVGAKDKMEDVRVREQLGPDDDGRRRALRRQSSLKVRAGGMKTDDGCQDLDGEADDWDRTSNPDDLVDDAEADDDDDNDMDYFNETKTKSGRRPILRTKSKARPSSSSGAKSRKKREKGTSGACPGRKTSDEIYSIHCEKCTAFFATQPMFDRHNQCVHEDPSHQSDIHTCPICDRMIWRQLGFQSHLKYHTNAEAVEEELKLWEGWPAPKKKGGSVNFTCKHCLMTHSHHHSFLSHMNAKHPEKGRSCTWTCRYCSDASSSTLERSDPEEFQSLKDLVWHIRTNHHTEYYGKTLKWGDQNLKNEDRPKRNCDICGKLMDVYYMKVHKIKEHSSVKTEAGATAPPHPPPSKISAAGALVNPEENKFQCPLKHCLMRLKTFALLRCHFICHLENNPFACKVPGCGVRCGAQCHLDRHLKIHTGEALHICPKCGLSFCKRDRLLVHICEEVDKTKIRHYADGSKRSNRAKLRLTRCPKSEIQELANENKRGRSRLDINSIILADPVFIKACEEDPEFEKVTKANIKVKSGSLNGSSKKSAGSGSSIPSNCPECGKEFSFFGSVQRHCLTFHGVKLLKSQSRGGPSKNEDSRKKKAGGTGAKSKRKRKVRGKRKYESSDDSEDEYNDSGRITEEDRFSNMPTSGTALVKVEPECNIAADLDSDYSAEANHQGGAIVDSKKIKVESDDIHPVVKIERELEGQSEPHVIKEEPAESESDYEMDSNFNKTDCEF